MAQFQPNRRQFLALTGALTAGLAVGFPKLSAAGIPPVGSNHIVIYGLSSRGRRASQAAKKNAANKRFRTIEAARNGRAHRGDSSRLTTFIVDREEFIRLFARVDEKGGKILIDTVDLRQL